MTTMNDTSICIRRVSFLCGCSVDMAVAVAMTGIVLLRASGCVWYLVGLYGISFALLFLLWPIYPMGLIFLTLRSFCGVRNRRGRNVWGTRVITLVVIVFGALGYSLGRPVHASVTAGLLVKAQTTNIDAIRNWMRTTEPSSLDRPWDVPSELWPPSIRQLKPSDVVWWHDDSKVPVVTVAWGGFHLRWGIKISLSPAKDAGDRVEVFTRPIRPGACVFCDVQ